jgi:3-phosphoshikimate 1-carboxyvinyltransferase
MIEIKPIQQCDAVIKVPGSKSYTHRALILSALADGESTLIDPLRSEDTEVTARGLERLGIPILWEGDSIRVLGRGGRLEGRDERINVGNSGTSMRFLTALAALKKGQTVLDGDDRMRVRPMGGLLESLEGLGAEARSQRGNDCPPVIIESQGLRGGRTKVRSHESSQYLSGLLMVAPYAREDVHLSVEGTLVSRPYIDITLSVMSAFGVGVCCEGDHSFFIPAGQRYQARDYRIEGDASNASYFFSAAAVTKGRVRVKNFWPTSIQGDAGFPEILERMGCQVVRGKDWVEVEGKRLRGIEIDMNTVPDLVPTLAVTAAFANGKTIIQKIGHLRLKESDRIHALAGELTKMGIRVEEGEDWLSIEGGEPHGAEIETHNDHRLAMSFAIAGLAISGIRIRNESCVNKSFPAFWEKLEGFYS